MKGALKAFKGRLKRGFKGFKGKGSFKAFKSLRKLQGRLKPSALKLPLREG